MCCSLPHGFHLLAAGSSSLFFFYCFNSFWTSFRIIYFTVFTTQPCATYLPFSLPFSCNCHICPQCCHLIFNFTFFCYQIFNLCFANLPSLSYTPPTPHSSIFPFFLCMSWHHRCVPNVPQTLFSTIKLLSLLSPAAARITWAEGALFKYRAAPGRRKQGV